MAKNIPTIEEIKQSVISNPLVAIDTIIGVASHGDQERSTLLLLLSQAILHYQNVDESIWKNNPTNTLFQKDLNHSTRSFIAICLLRLLASCDQCFQGDANFKHKAFNLMDDIFTNDLYKSYNIYKNDQTYEKESKLRDIPPSIEREIASIINSLNNLENLSKEAFRKSFMNVILSRKAQLIVLPFLPQNTSQSLSMKVGDIFSSLEAYLKAPESMMLQVFENAKSDLSSYLYELEKFGTIYSCEYLGNLIEKLLHLLDIHFKSSPFSKPAHLVVTSTEKKYPISASHTSFDLGVLIKNEGSGHAFDVLLRVDSDVFLRRSEIYLGQIGLISTVVDIPAYVEVPIDKANLVGELCWTDYSGKKELTEFIFEIESQRTDIDWNVLSEDNPYDLEPVSTENELVGRMEILNKLISQSKAKSVGSSYIYGQKRVGKTSIAKTLKTRLHSSNNDTYLVIYLETGDYKDPDAGTTIENLGRRLCREIRRADSNFSQLPIPDFKGSLSPFTDFLEEMLDINPDVKILFVLDEFDEIPKDLYRRSPIGDAFFLTLRSISGKASFGFILVGGEKMEYLLSNQGERLNKFEPARVDYFDRSVHWSDFKDLVQRPVSHFLEITDEAFAELYEKTAGNPYFTKLICRSLFKLLVNRRDCHVTRKEVEEATREATRVVASNSFQHFWEDGVVDTDERVEERTIVRRKVLIALAKALKNHSAAQKSNIIEYALALGLSERDTDIELQDFVRRQILLVNEDTYTCKVPFFSMWLQERGVREIITSYIDPDLIAKYEKEEEISFVRPEEIINLIKNKNFYYKGKHLSDGRIRAWLNQFSNNVEQRFMFRILQELIFYDHSTIRQRLEEAHKMVRADSLRYMKSRERKRDDIIVSYLDGPGKSGATYASLYAELADIAKSNIVELGKLKHYVLSINKRPPTDQPHSLVFIDDFVGTGGSAGKYFRQINSLCGDQLRESKLRVFFIAISGYEQGKIHIEHVLDELKLTVRVRICDLLGDADRCFSESSKIFSDPREREVAKNIAERYSTSLVPSQPFGFGNCQAYTVFEDTCPNNNLPIIWSDANNWIPLFRRD